MEGFKLPLSQYLDNPAGKGAVFAHANIIKEDFNKRYSVLEKSIKCRLFENDDNYFCIVDVPSENVLTMKYNVVFKFIKDDNIKKLTDLETHYFSNMPSFTYTYAYVFNLNGMIVSECYDKGYEDAFINPAFNRNSNRVIGFEKSLYFAGKYISEHYTKDSFKKAGKFDIDTIETLVKSCEEIEKERKVKYKRQRIAEKKSVQLTLARKLKDEKKKRRNITSTTSTKSKVIQPKGKIDGTSTNNKSGTSNVKRKTKIRGKAKR